MMKKTFAFAALASVIAFGACRKTEPVTLPENGVIGEPHCSNGVRDADEDGVDCGPTCGPCVLSYPIMGTVPEANELSIAGTTVTFPSANVLADSSSGVLVITATTNGGVILTATFGKATPEVFRSYAITQYTPDSNEVSLTYNDGTAYTAYSNTDNVHLNRVNGKYSMLFADVYMSYSSGWGVSYESVSGHINPAN